MELIPQADARGEVIRALLLSEVFGTPYSEMPLYALERALRGRDVEYQITEVVVDARIVGIAIVGPIAGTVGTARIYAVAPTSLETRDVGVRALHSAMNLLGNQGIRLVIAELPEDSPMEPMRKLLLKFGFQEESRVDDLIRDGVALTFLRYEIT